MRFFALPTNFNSNNIYEWYTYVFFGCSVWTQRRVEHLVAYSGMQAFVFYGSSRSARISDSILDTCVFCKHLLSQGPQSHHTGPEIQGVYLGTQLIEITFLYGLCGFPCPHSLIEAYKSCLRKNKRYKYSKLIQYMILQSTQ